MIRFIIKLRSAVPAYVDFNVTGKQTTTGHPYRAHDFGSAEAAREFLRQIDFQAHLCIDVRYYPKNWETYYCFFTDGNNEKHLTCVRSLLNTLMYSVPVRDLRPGDTAHEAYLALLKLERQVVTMNF